MRILTLAAAAAIAVAGLTAAPAMAQPGHDNHGRDMRHHASDRDDNGRHNGWNNHHRRQVCRWVWRHHHRQRVCTWRHW